MNKYQQSYRTNNPVYSFRAIGWRSALIILGACVIVYFL